MALTKVSKETVWSKGLVSELGLKKNGIRQGAVYLAKNQAYHARCKHIGVRYHSVRDLVNFNEMVIENVHIDENACSGNTH